MNPSRCLVVFDLDGTLVDTFDDIRSAVNQALEAHGLPAYTTGEVRRFVGDGLTKLVERCLPPDRQELGPDVCDRVRTYYADHPVDFSDLYPGVPTMLADLRRSGFKTAILSNKLDGLVQAIARELGLMDLVDEVWGKREEFPLKPDPTSLHALQDRLRAESAVMVGDGLPDVEVAKAANARFVGVSWGIVDKEILSQAGPVASTAADLPHLVRTILEA